MKTLTFDESEIQRVSAIVMDGDREEALVFLRSVIWERIRDKESKPCGPKAV
jgi:hypothetical protein